jgi:TonB family protein
MKTVTEVPNAPVVETRKPSLLSRASARCSGTFVSLFLHGSFVALALFSVSAPRSGRGGGIVGRPDGGSGLETYSAQLRQESLVDGERSPDERLYPAAEPEAEETADALPPPAEDFLDQPAEDGVPVATIPPPPEASHSSRPRDAYTKLPPPAASEIEEASPPGNGQKGNSTVNGSGGNTGGAGDGNTPALYMPSPEYPSSARRRGIEGAVTVAIEVHPDGHCEHPQLAESSGCDALDEAALNAIQKWKYDARLDTIVRRVRFVFKLQK